MGGSKQTAEEKPDLLCSPCSGGQSIGIWELNGTSFQTDVARTTGSKDSRFARAKHY